MSREAPTDGPGLAEEWEVAVHGQSTRDRVYAVALQLYEPTRVAEVAERADVSKETARDYCKWFAELGLIEQTERSPDAFARNEAYFRWRRIQRLQARSVDGLAEELRQLVDSERIYRDRYDADAPGEVDALDHVDYDDVESVWMDLQEWRTIQRRIRELEEARRNRDGTPEVSV